MANRLGLVGAAIAAASIIFAAGGVTTRVLGNTARLEKVETVVDLLAINQTRLITILEEQRRNP